MAESTKKYPQRRDDLEIQQISSSECVVKLSPDRKYFSVGPKEAWLLRKMNGYRSPRRLRRKYEDRFGESISEQDVVEFINSVTLMGLLKDNSQKDTSKPDAAALAQEDSKGTAVESGSKKKKLFGQSAIFFRIPLYDPDRLLSWLEPRIRWVWTRSFAVVAVLLMLTALVVTISSGQQLLTAFPSLLSVESIVLFTVVVLAATAVHEMAHGLTCKHFGGEVHETGVLFMFFIPCMYCNVSDAWLIPDKTKRLLITLAGGFADLCLWALAVFVWRVTVPGVLLNQIAMVVLTVCGGRSLLNFNPLLRLDGYYLLADWLAIPNLRKRGLEYWMAHLRWILWGAERPQPIPQGRTLLTYGMSCWFFAIGLLNMIVIRFFAFLSSEFGLAGLIFICLFLMFGLRRVFKGFFQTEPVTMIQERPKRTAVWLGTAALLLLLLFAIPIRRTTSGEFEVRPGQIVQQHVAVTGIVNEIFVEDGQQVAVGSLIARLRSPELEQQIRTTQDQLIEVEASLARLEAGTRPEELLAQKERVRRLESWYAQGQEELAQARLAHEQNLLILEQRLQTAEGRLEYATHNYDRSQDLYDQGALAGAQLRAQRMEVMLAESRVTQEQAAFKAESATGTRTKEAEITRRSQELAEAKERLSLMQAGSRPEDIAAERARQQRIAHDLEYLQDRLTHLEIKASADGILSATRLREKIGQVVLKDTVFCTIEDPHTSWVEIAVAEEDAPAVKAGQPVRLKARAIPFETFHATVEGIAPTATQSPDATSSVVIIHCHIDNPDGRLKPGMSGFGRIERGRNPMGLTLASKAMRYIRTEFWW